MTGAPTHDLGEGSNMADEIRISRVRYGGEIYRSHPVLADGRKLGRLRENSGLSVAELSERSGISTSAIYALQKGPKGRTWAERHTLKKLAEALGATPNDLLQHSV